MSLEQGEEVILCLGSEPVAQSKAFLLPICCSEIQAVYLGLLNLKHPVRGKDFLRRMDNTIAKYGVTSPPPPGGMRSVGLLEGGKSLNEVSRRPRKQ